MLEGPFQAFTVLAGLPEVMMEDFMPIGAEHASQLDWITYLNADAVPNFESVQDFQKYIDEAGFRAQLELLKSDAPGARLGMLRIEEMVYRVNTQVLERDEFLVKGECEPRLKSLAIEMGRLFKTEVFNAKYTGETYMSNLYPERSRLLL